MQNALVNYNLAFMRKKKLALKKKKKKKVLTEPHGERKKTLKITLPLQNSPPPVILCKTMGSARAKQLGRIHPQVEFCKILGHTGQTGSTTSTHRAGKGKRLRHHNVCEGSTSDRNRDEKKKKKKKMCWYLDFGTSRTTTRWWSQQYKKREILV